MTEKTTNSRQRIIDHGEVFTPPELDNDMLNLVGNECEQIESRFLEPACGDGSLGVFNSGLMNDAVWKFRRYEDASLRYMGIACHGALQMGLWDTALSEEDFQATFEGLANE